MHVYIDPEKRMFQESVLILSLILMTVVAGAFVFVAANTNNFEEDFDSLRTKSYSIRTKFFWFLAVMGVVITVSTTQVLPYAATRGFVSGDELQINVVGKQWYWEMDANEATAGDTVLFNVSSGDVNHGFGIYDSDLRLLGQTQAMPGYTNKLRYTFDKPGEYRLLCMEYCGVAHHVMISNFVVKPNQGAK